MSKRVRPFSCGMQYMDWLDRNCCRCARYSYDAARQVVLCSCPINRAISLACVSDGTITQRMAERMGYRQDAYTWDCPEIVRYAKAVTP